MKKLMKTSLVIFLLLFACNMLYAQKNRNTVAEFDVNHPAPQIVSVHIGEANATVHLVTNTSAKYDIISCKNILTGEKSQMRQAAAETVYLNNLDAASYYEVYIQHAYADGEVSKTLQFCFSTELASEGISLQAQRYDEAGK